MSTAKDLIDYINSLGIYNPNDISKVVDITDELPVNKEGIEDQIELLDRILKGNKFGNGSKIQGLANIGIIKLGLG